MSGTNLPATRRLVGGVSAAGPIQLGRAPSGRATCGRVRRVSVSAGHRSASTRAGRHAAVRRVRRSPPRLPVRQMLGLPLRAPRPLLVQDTRAVCVMRRQAHGPASCPSRRPCDPGCAHTSVGIDRPNLPEGHGQPRPRFAVEDAEDFLARDLSADQGEVHRPGGRCEHHPAFWERRESPRTFPCLGRRWLLARGRQRGASVQSGAPARGRDGEDRLVTHGGSRARPPSTDGSPGRRSPGLAGSTLMAARRPGRASRLAADGPGSHHINADIPAGPRAVRLRELGLLGSTPPFASKRTTSPAENGSAAMQPGRLTPPSR